MQGLKEGRNYVSDGKSHLMDFRVNDVEMGTGKDVELAQPGTVKIAVEAAAYLDPEPNDEIRQRKLDAKPYWHIERARLANSRRVPVELVVNGVAVERQEIAADGKIHQLSFTPRIDRSAWVAVRILPSSHTNPVWVTVGKQPVRERQSIEWCLRAVDQCRNQKIGRIRPEEQKEFHQAYDFAKQEYQRRLNGR